MVMNLPAGMLFLAALACPPLSVAAAPGKTAVPAAPALIATNVPAGSRLGKQMEARTNWTLRLSPAQTNSPPKVRRYLPSGPAEPLKPGVYEAFPFTCIVVVPGPHPDDKSAFPMPGSQDRMPMVEPELRLIPRSQKP
jgi:hypothetical protein